MARRVAFLITHDEGTAEDVSQEAILAALSALPEADLSHPLGPWIERIAANRSIDAMRRRRVRSETPIDFAGEVEDSQLADETAALVREAISADVMSALRDLPIENRTAVVLRHLLGYAPSEISVLVDAPPATVRTRIHRALLSLRSTLSDPTRSQT